MKTSLLNYNNLPNIPREMRRALFRQYLAKLGGMGMYDPVSLDKMQGGGDGLQSWLLLPLWLCSEHPQSRLIQQEEGMALAAALWLLARDRRIKVRPRMILARWARMSLVWASCDKIQKNKKTQDILKKRENIIITVRAKKQRWNIKRKKSNGTE